MKVTDEMIDVATSNYLNARNDGYVREAIHAALIAALQTAPEVEQQEPVAIVRRYRDGTIAAHLIRHDFNDCDRLYAHPQPKREQPLSEEEVLSLALKHTSENHEGFPIFDCYGFASEIEKAHRIGDE